MVPSSNVLKTGGIPGLQDLVGSSGRDPTQGGCKWGVISPSLVAPGHIFGPDAKKDPQGVFMFGGRFNWAGKSMRRKLCMFLKQFCIFPQVVRVGVFSQDFEAALQNLPKHL